MATQNLGPRPSRPTDMVDVEWVSTTYPSLSAYISATANFTFTLPAEPLPDTMLLIEVFAHNQVVATVPGGTVLTVGVQPATVIAANKTAFFGFRYSPNAGAWFLLSATTQV